MIDVNSMGDLGKSLNTLVKMATEMTSKINDNNVRKPKIQKLNDGSVIVLENVVAIKKYKKWPWSKEKTEISYNNGNVIIANCKISEIKI
jgi:3-phosphoglycerate kinase